MRAMRRYYGLTIAALCLVTFAATVSALYARPRPAVAPDMQVALPRFVQVVMAVGDRYLAANLAVVRSLVASTENMGADNYRIQGIAQADAAWLNPRHEDNYYIAAAILPWNGEVGAAQTVLRAASESRPLDWQPAFYLGFNTLHFMKQPAEAANWLLVGARQTPDHMQALQLQQLAAFWLAKGEDLQLAVRIHRAMARETKYKAFAAFLEKRAVRLENMILLDTAINRYRERFGRTPDALAQLVESGVVSLLPIDPFGEVYEMGPSGRAVSEAPHAATARARSSRQ